MLKKTIMREESGQKRKVLPRGSEAEKKELEAFIKDVNFKTFDTINFIDASEDWIKSCSANVKDPRNSMNKLNAMHQRQLLAACLNPLKNGVSTKSLLQVAGFYVGLSLANKDIKRDIDKVYHGLMGSLYDGANNLIENGFVFKGMDENKKSALLEKLRGFRDKHAAAGNGGRMPFSPQSASAVYLNLCKSCYDGCRKEPDGQNEHRDHFVRAKTLLFAMAEHDGISRDELSKNTRLMVGKLLDTHPDMKYIFSGLSDGSIVKAPSQEISVDDIDADGNAIRRRAWVWDGEFIDKNGNSVNDFVPRDPMSYESYLRGCKSILKESFSCMTKPSDISMLGASMDYAIRRFNGEDAKIPIELKGQDKLLGLSKELAEHLSAYKHDSTGDYVNIIEGIRLIFKDEFEQFTQDRPDVVYGYQSNPNMGYKSKAERQAYQYKDVSDIFDKEGDYEK